MSTHSVRLVVLSDTHELHREIDPVPNGDLLLCAGDFSFFGQSRSAIRDFDMWLGELPHAHKVIVLGNHEAAIARDAESARSLIRNGMVLWNEGTEAMGIRIWGTAPAHNSAILSRRRSLGVGKQYAAIPEGLDILLTHEPPLGILDTVPPLGEHAGSRELSDAVRRTHPRLHVFGHIHAGYGWFQSSLTTFVNASLMGAEGDLENRPVVLQIAPHEDGIAS